MRQNLQNRFYAIGSLYDITTMSASADATVNIAVWFDRIDRVAYFVVCDVESEAFFL